MESLGTQTGILTIRWILAWIALLQVVLQVVIIGAENLDPVQFTFSANFPKNKSLNPLPKHFDKFGDSENDCCTLVLFFEVKDLDMEGDSDDPPKMEGAQAQTGTGEATFKFEHPDIRDTDKSFTMDVAMDQDLVKSRHILNFDTCSSIIQKTYNIFATTSITDVKDVKVIVVNGKDDNIKCQPIRPTPAITTTIPFSNAISKTTEIPVIKAEVSPLTIGLVFVACVTTLISIVCILALVYVVRRMIPKIDTEARYRNEKCVAGGDDSDDDDNEKCIVKGGGKGVTTTGLERVKTIKKILIITAIICILLAIISVVAILLT